MSIYGAIAISAFIDGIFSGYYLKTGVDASPSGLGVQIITILEPLLPSQAHWQADFYKILILALPWVITAVTILKAPDKRIALIIFAVSLILGILAVYFTIH
ncbi:MAG: hypothetical protein HY222_01655 [Thaumarchaeota archaeon]|nr:hypothetical protein [Nitrososphaerota archaeon]MBI3641080.1 hypothetical protein [Nitrososphaerota archaeon]